MLPRVPNLFPASTSTPSAGEGQSSASRSVGRSHPYERSQGAWLLKFVDFNLQVTTVQITNHWVCTAPLVLVTSR